MKRKLNLLSLLLLMFMPSIVHASSSSETSPDLGFGLFISFFFVAVIYAFLPHNQFVARNKTKFIFGIIALRVLILYILYIVIGTSDMIMVDFFMIWGIGFFGGIMKSIFDASRLVSGKSEPAYNPIATKPYDETGFLKCSNCNRFISSLDRYCPGCHTPTSNVNARGICKNCGFNIKDGQLFCPKCGKNVQDLESIIPMNGVETPVIEGDPNTNPQLLLRPLPKVEAPPPIVYANPADYNSIYALDEKEMLIKVINDEFDKCGFKMERGFVPKKVHTRKKISYLILALLLFLFVNLIFFHLDKFIYIGLFAIIVVLIVVICRFNVNSYLIKEIKSRPSEKISNIVIGITNDFVKDRSLGILIVGILISLLLPCLLFYKPRQFYELNPDRNSYSLRFYTLGITGNEKAVIPDTYNGKLITGIRGNVFMDLPSLKEVVLPDRITEIRGAAFKNDTSLTTINLPENLEYIGGSAFYNCTSLESIYIPTKVTYIGGEAFSHNTSLKEVVLPEGLQEIRGNTFEYCSSLESINIPNSVTRIGGHAFYGNHRLSKVDIKVGSKLEEIGSSAFRQCYNLASIYIPSRTIVNERAFKESPTIIKRYGVDDIDIDYDKEEQVEDPVIEEPKEEQKKEEPKEEPKTEEPKEEPKTEKPKEEKPTYPEVYIESDYSVETIDPNTTVLFKKANVTIKYVKYNDNGSVDIRVTYKNGKSMNVTYNLKTNTYHAFDDYVLTLHQSYEKQKIAIGVYEVVPMSNGYKYYASPNMSENEEILFRTDKYGYLVKYLGITNGNVLSSDFIVSGTKVSLTEENNEYKIDNFRISLKIITEGMDSFTFYWK